MEVKSKREVYCCPSKVLIMGGYAILSESSVGLSVGLNEKFYVFIDETKINDLKQSSQSIEQSQQQSIESQIEQPEKQEQQSIEQPEQQQNNKQEDNSIRYIRFISKQIDSEWTYRINLKELTFEQIMENNKINNNVFLESVVEIIIKEGIKQDIQTIFKSDLIVNLYHDNKFFSSSSQLKQDQSNNNQSELFYKFDKNNLHKTGLGSSACVLVISIGGLLKYFNEFTYENLHYLSQKANFIAQKKIGSGFDISTSVFGSQIYRRFPPDYFNKQEQQQNQLQQYNWNSYKQFNIPKELKILMIDLSIGSDTRKLAGEVKKYLDNNKEQAEQFYQKNNECADRLQEIFKNINNINELREQKENIIKLNQEYRQIFKSIGEQSNVETEPDVLSQILNSIVNNIQEVYYAVCPGAGGYDALCLLVENTFDIDNMKKILDKIQLNYPQIQNMVLSEILISNQGFRELKDQELECFFNKIF